MMILHKLKGIEQR